MTPDAIVDHYTRYCRKRARAEMRFFEIQRSASDAIGKAALCLLPSGKRHPHQRRIPEALLELAEARLQAVGKHLAVARDFEALHEIVKSEIGSVRGIGALTVYDISHRIGAYFGKAPARVYLHAGTKKGAAVFGLSGDSVDPRNLPSPFSRLTAAEIEDCLCIYRNDLRGAQRAERRGIQRCGLPRPGQPSNS